jgi:hypothetical protein
MMNSIGDVITIPVSIPVTIPILLHVRRKKSTIFKISVYFDRLTILRVKKLAGEKTTA